MSKIRTAIKLLKENRCEFWASVIVNSFKWLPDTPYLKLLYKFKTGHTLNLKHPKTFTEKIQWLKLYNRQPEYTKMVDKYLAKHYVEDLICKDYIIPTLGIWDKPEDIDWDILPEKFVLKTTHGGGNGGVVICKDKSSLNKKQVVEKLNKSLASDIYRNLREWPYKNVTKRIIAEQFVSSNDNDESADLIDYKFFCFNGEPKYCQVIRDRKTNETIDFYDMNWHHMDFVGLNPSVNNGLTPVPRPTKIEEMISICRKLSKGIPFLRVDLYHIDNKVLFGELTFFPASGFGRFNPEDWNEKLGAHISQLSK